MTSKIRKTVLHIDDNEDFAEMLKNLITENTDLDVKHVNSGRLALEYLNQSPENLVGVISDLMMNDMDGIDVLAAIRNSKSLAGIPLIMLSGADPNVFANLLEPYDFSVFIQKPADVNVLLREIEMNFLGRRGAARKFRAA